MAKKPPILIPNVRGDLYDPAAQLRAKAGLPVPPRAQVPTPAAPEPAPQPRVHFRNAAELEATGAGPAEIRREYELISARIEYLDRAGDLTDEAVRERDGLARVCDGIEAMESMQVVDRTGVVAPSAERTGVDGWAAEVAARASRSVGEFGMNALTTGGIDTPSVVESVVVKPVEPVRVLDLLINRKPLTGNEFEFLRQTVRTNNAGAVADNATKPTSVYTFEDESDRARVFAHLSEPIPIRYLDDHDELERILRSQMAEDLMLALEENVLVGDGTGENFTGLTNTAGVQTQAYATDVLTTLRKARTKLVTSGERPTAWVLNWDDLEAIDLTRESGATGGFMGGIEEKVFGNLPKIGTSTIPAGVAYLGDWNQARLYVRDGGRLDADVSGELFDKNQVKLRYEGRFGFAALRPAAFVEIDLTSA